ncbi:hypothetical protein UT300005_18860 [Clostridium sp. CTA-5]
MCLNYFSSCALLSFLSFTNDKTKAVVAAKTPKSFADFFKFTKYTPPYLNYTFNHYIYVF